MLTLGALFGDMYDKLYIIHLVCISQILGSTK